MLRLAFGSRLDVVVRIVFAENAIDIRLTHDHDNNSSSFLDHTPLLASYSCLNHSVHICLALTPCRLTRRIWIYAHTKHTKYIALRRMISHASRPDCQFHVLVLFLSDVSYSSMLTCTSFLVNLFKCVIHFRFINVVFIDQKHLCTIVWRYD